jgi:putative endonuclease
MDQYWIYIMTNPKNTVLYTGMTNDLMRRVTEHKNHAGSQFTDRHYLTKLVYCESFPTPKDAIAREKQTKGGSRAKKIDLIRSINPEWKDLSIEP